jgi:S1 RNA binding domain protein
MALWFLTAISSSDTERPRNGHGGRNAPPSPGVVLTGHSGRCHSATLPKGRVWARRQDRKGAELTDLEVGAVVEGTVTRITPYGAFLTLEGGKVGLVHISEIDRNYVKDVHEHLRENDVVQAKVIAIKEDGKIDLSIKALQDPAPQRPRRGSDPSFESMLKRFMRSSEERQVDYKRSVEHKRK